MEVKTEPIDKPAGDVVGAPAVVIDNPKPFGVGTPAADVEPAAPAPAARPEPRPTGRPKGARDKTRRKVKSTTTTTATIRPRLIVTIEDDGRIDVAHTNPDAVARLKTAIADPTLRERLGLVADVGAPLPAPRAWDKTIAETLVDAVNMIAVQAAVNTWKLTDDQAALFVMRRKPETHAAFTSVTGELLDKYFPGGAGQWDLELRALLLAGGFLAEAIQACKAMRSPATVHQFPNAGEQSH
jgi:hypothetical protein